MTSAGAEPISVSDAVGVARAAVESMPTLLVTGEVSGFRGPARTGHCYFQIKDDASAMDAIVWKGVYRVSGIQLRDGLQVLIAGRFQIYAPTGKLSFVAKSLQVSGEGLLRQQVAALAKRLETEGLMDPARKRRIPAFCTRVAVVTSPTGSVIDDVKRTLARRNPLVEILISGCAVQGEGAAVQVVQALSRAAAAQPEAILLVRGGGSYEDLMTFNDESLARAVAACPVPVITGIGHEPDTCICDMVADRRCSTPTAAAESVAPAFDEIARSFHDRERRLANAMGAILGNITQLTDTFHMRLSHAQQARISNLRVSVDALGDRRCLQNPFSSLEDRANQVALTEQRLHDAMPRILARLTASTDAMASRRCLQDPMSTLWARGDGVEQIALRLMEVEPRQLTRFGLEMDAMARRLGVAAPRMLRTHEAQLKHSAAQLEALSPLKVLARGYAIMQNDEGHVVNDARTLSAGDAVTVLVGRGKVLASVTDTVDEDSQTISRNNTYRG